MDRRNDKSKSHILVVDDDRLIVATLSAGLQQAGYQISEANSGDDALRRAGERKPDLALLDMRMPRMSGIELAQRLAAMDIPFIFLSAYRDEPLVKDAAERGALGYLVKPLDVPQIIPSLEAALVRAAEIRQLREKETQLSAALEGDRATSMAVGILMERRGLDRAEAFEALRTSARSQQRKLKDLAAEIVKAAEIINQPQNSGRQIPPPLRSRPPLKKGVTSNAPPRSALRFLADSVGKRGKKLFPPFSKRGGGDSLSVAATRLAVSS